MPFKLFYAKRGQVALYAPPPPIEVVLTSLRSSGLSTYDDNLDYRREREYLTLVLVHIAQKRIEAAGIFLHDALDLPEV